MHLSQMKRSLRRALLHDAGRVRELKSQLERLQNERRNLTGRIASLERQIDDAQRRFDATYEEVSRLGERAAAGADVHAGSLTQGKLPHRILEWMRRNPTQIYTASGLAVDLAVGDVQQVRTALARLVQRELVRRTDVRGEFTI